MPQADSADTTTLSRRRFVTASATALAVAPVATTQALAISSTTLADAEIIALGNELDRLISLERAAWDAVPDGASDYSAAEAASSAVSEVLEKIAVVRATTPEGLRVKARGIDWCHSFEGPIYLAYNDAATDITLAQSIVRDLLKSWPENDLIPDAGRRFRIWLSREDQKLTGFHEVDCDPSEPIREGDVVVTDVHFPHGGRYWQDGWHNHLTIGKVVKMHRSDGIRVTDWGGRMLPRFKQRQMCRVTGMSRYESFVMPKDCVEGLAKKHSAGGFFRGYEAPVA